MLALGGILALTLIGYLLLTTDSAPPVGAARLVDDPLRGAGTPRVEIVEFGDFGCHSCQAWHQAGIADRILDAYGEHVAFTFRDFPVITPQSPRAAEAAQCAYDQDQFWPYHDLLYARAPRLNVPDLKAYADEIGLDRAAFEQCLDSGAHRATVDYDLQAARDLRLRGTPSFMVNGQVLTGPPTYDVLVGLIEAELAGGGR